MFITKLLHNKIIILCALTAVVVCFFLHMYPLLADESYLIIGLEQKAPASNVLTLYPDDVLVSSFQCQSPNATRFTIQITTTANQSNNGIIMFCVSGGVCRRLRTQAFSGIAGTYTLPIKLTDEARLDGKILLTIALQGGQADEPMLLVPYQYVGGQELLQMSMTPETYKLSSPCAERFYPAWTTLFSDSKHPAPSPEFFFPKRIKLFAASGNCTLLSSAVTKQ